jgi:hypothetical protein
MNWCIIRTPLFICETLLRDTTQYTLRLYCFYLGLFSRHFVLADKSCANRPPVGKAVVARNPVTMAHGSPGSASENSAVTVTGSVSTPKVLVACKPDMYDIE